MKAYDSLNVVKYFLLARSNIQVDLDLHVNSSVYYVQILTEITIVQDVIVYITIYSIINIRSAFTRGQTDKHSAKQEEWFTFSLLNTSMKISTKTHGPLEPIKKKKELTLIPDIRCPWKLPYTG